MMNPERDVVCGMTVDPTRSPSASFRERKFFFCSEYCKDAFLASPWRYAGETGPSEVARDEASRRIAYFSMEVGIDPRLPIYSGGLGVLAGDTLRSFADLRIPAVAVSLLYTKGYFHQVLDRWGNQSEQTVEWNPAAALCPLTATVRASVANKSVAVRAWRYDVTGATGYTVPLILLDTNLDDNAAPERELTSFLYGGDERYRLSQEIVLGIGGVRILRELGYTRLERFHMNEGHASLLALELLAEEADHAALAHNIEDVKRRCVFTTHTPVPAGHDQFSYDLVREVVGEPVPFGEIRMLAGDDKLNMTRLALNLAHYVNGVAKRHGEVSQEMFPGYRIDHVTNGVHSLTWTCESFRRLYDHHIPGWSRDPFSLRYAVKIPPEEIWDAHAEAKRRLLEEVGRRTSRSLDVETLTIGFARRATAYKRADLVFHDSVRLLDIARKAGPLQLVFAGKAHPRDEPGKDLIRRIFHIADELKDNLAIVFLEDYDMDLARLLTSGVDLWLNTPRPPLEASGTSGMKAAHNGIPSFSVLDGWWIEGNIEGVTGWSIGPELRRDAAAPNDADVPGCRRSV